MFSKAVFVISCLCSVDFGTSEVVLEIEAPEIIVERICNFDYECYDDECCVTSFRNIIYREPGTCQSLAQIGEECALFKVGGGGSITNIYKCPCVENNDCLEVNDIDYETGEVRVKGKCISNPPHSFGPAYREVDYRQLVNSSDVSSTVPPHTTGVGSSTQTKGENVTTRKP